MYTKKDYERLGNKMTHLITDGKAIKAPIDVINSISFIPKNFKSTHMHLIHIKGKALDELKKYRYGLMLDKQSKYHFVVYNGYNAFAYNAPVAINKNGRYFTTLKDGDGWKHKISGKVNNVYMAPLFKYSKEKGAHVACCMPMPLIKAVDLSRKLSISQADVISQEFISYTVNRDEDVYDKLVEMCKYQYNSPKAVQRYTLVGISKYNKDFKSIKDTHKRNVSNSIFVNLKKLITSIIGEDEIDMVKRSSCDTWFICVNLGFHIQAVFTCRMNTKFSEIETIFMTFVDEVADDEKAVTYSMCHKDFLRVVSTSNYAKDIYRETKSKLFIKGVTIYSKPKKTLQQRSIMNGVKAQAIVNRYKYR